jgi:hypothetical protein
VYRFVISAEDPGVPNWLDTEGHNRGLMFMRWQGWDLDGSPLGPEDHNPTCQVVPLEDVLDYFPEDVPIYSEADRKAQLYERQVHVHERYGW